MVGDSTVVPTCVDLDSNSAMSKDFKSAYIAPSADKELCLSHTIQKIKNWSGIGLQL
jgi:hypothetical protein